MTSFNCDPKTYEEAELLDAKYKREHEEMLRRFKAVGIPDERANDFQHLASNVFHMVFVEEYLAERERSLS